MTEETRILIVEDEPALRELYREILADLEMDVEEDLRIDAVESVEDALPLLEMTSYEMVLTDFRLPVRNGIELIQIIQEKYPQTPCLLISGFVDAGLTRKALEAGAYSCLQKPCSIDTLLRTAREALLSRRSDMSGAEEPAAKRIYEIIEANFINTLFVDRDFRIELGNTSFQKEYGDHRDNTCHRVIGASATPCRECQAAAAIASGKPKTIIRDGRSPEGERWKIEERVEPWLDSDGHCTGLMISFTPLLSDFKSDPTPRRTRLSRIGGHRPTHPLVCLPKPEAIATMAELIARALRQPDCNLLTLAENLSSLARRCERSPKVRADIGAIIQPVLSRVSALAEAKAVRIDLTLCEDLPAISFSPPRLEQALLNLLLNAIEAAPAETGRVRIKTRKTPSHVELCVCDNGPGCPSIERMVEHPLSVISGGSIGLAVAGHLVASEGGVLLWKSESCDEERDEKGFCAIMRIPRKDTRE